MSEIEITQPTGAIPPSRSMAWRIKAIFGGSVGNLVEWYDWYVYSAFSLYFAKSFFPSGDQTAQLLNTAAVFAAGFLVRPIGSWLMGVYADKHGRRNALVMSMVVMGLGSLVIAVTPSYESIGFFAPLLLVFARVGQGLSVGGEYAASATYLSEVAGKKLRGFFGSFQYVTLIMGQLLALATAVVLQSNMEPAALSSWGWRIPFVIGAILSILALFVMLRLEETQSFEEMKKRAKPVNTWKLMAEHPKELLIVLGLTCGGSLGFYTFSTYIQQFLANTSGFSKETATEITTVAMLIFMCVQPLFGWISDKAGRKPLLIAFGVLGTLATVPIMTTLSDTKDVAMALGLVTLALVIQSCYTSISGLFKAEMFPTEIRALGVGLPYAIGVSVVGGTGPFVALLFKQEGHESFFYWYVTFFIAIFLITAICARDMKAHSKILED
jgi:MHS family alpha-ketoglutarate permease-like MFS transporter